MAYINQEMKREIAANLKKVIPTGWKYTVGIRNHSELVLTFRAGPTALATVPAHWDYNNIYVEQEVVDHRTINPYYLKDNLLPELQETFAKIVGAMNTGNWDNSDPMTDYFDVGFYIKLSVGEWDKPYKITIK